jgi:hypothetical protein
MVSIEHMTTSFSHLEIAIPCGFAPPQRSHRPDRSWQQVVLLRRGEKLRFREDSSINGIFLFSNFPAKDGVGSQSVHIEGL